MSCFWNLIHGGFMLLLSLLITGVMAANPFHLAGVYQFTGEIKKIQSKRVIPVYTFSEAGKRQLRELRAKGYQCKSLPRQTYRCQNFDNTLIPAPHVLKRAEKDYSSFDLYISGAQVIPQIISEGESVIVYRFNKTIAVNEIELPYFDYQITYGQNSIIHKLKFGEGSRRKEFLVKNSGELQKVLLLSDQEPSYYDQFVLSGIFVN